MSAARPVSQRRVVAAVVVLLVAGGVVDRVAGRESAPVAVTSASAMPTAAPAGALSSTWYCAGGSAQADSAIAGAIVVANPTATAAHGTVSLVSAPGGATGVAAIDVGPRSSTVVRLPAVINAPYAAALVQVAGGQVAVEHIVGGPQGSNVAPCASAPSTSWYFADGSTAKDATLFLALYNPFPDDAIADLSFATDQGRAVPADFQGLVAPAHTVVMVNVGDHVRRREWVATQVNVRSGRVVADEIMLRTAPGKAGVSLELGSPAPQRSWWFPDGYASDKVVERYTVFNPSGREARVELTLTLDQGSAEPFDLTVPAQGHASLVTNDQARIPKGVGHAATVVSLDGPPVVAQRTVETAPGAERTGRADMLGAPRSARQWLLALGQATTATDEWVVVFNPGTRPAVVSVTGLADGQPLAVEGLQKITVAAGRRAAFRLTDHVKRDAIPVVVTSSRPVVVERDLFNVTAPGMSSVIGVPLDGP